MSLNFHGEQLCHQFRCFRIIMKPLHLITILFVFVIFLSLQVFVVSAAEEDAEETDVAEEPERTCKKYLYNLVQGFLTGALNCLGGKFQMKSIFELGTRFYCLFKCVLSDVGVLGANGRLDEVAALFYFQEAIPEIILDVVLGDAQPCLEMASLFQPSQYYCQSYSPFIQCVFNSLVKTLGPYALNCYATPGLGFFFSFINVIVPQASPPTSNAAATEIRKRFTEARLRYDKRHHHNSTTPRIENMPRMMANFTNQTIPTNKVVAKQKQTVIPPFKPMPK